MVFSPVPLKLIGLNPKSIKCIVFLNSITLAIDVSTFFKRDHLPSRTGSFAAI